MARRFTLNNYLKLASHPDIGSEGSIFVKHKPVGWSSGDSAEHALFDIGKNSPLSLLRLQKYSDNNLYAGFYFGGGAHWIMIADTGLFSDGNWADWLIEWGTPVVSHNVTRAYRNGTELAYVDAGALAFGIDTGLAFTLGTGMVPADNTGPANGDIAEYARWDRVLTPGERDDLFVNGKGPGCITSGLVHWVKVLGDASPEPADIGGDLVLVGTPSQQAHPTVDNCSAMTIVPAAISITPEIPNPSVQFPPLSVQPSAIALTPEIPSLTLTMATMSINPSAIALTAVIPSPSVGFRVPKGVRITISDSLASG